MAPASYFRRPPAVSEWSHHAGRLESAGGAPPLRGKTPGRTTMCFFKPFTLTLSSKLEAIKQRMPEQGFVDSESLPIRQIARFAHP
jgi:hypothetical protein